MKLSEFSSLLKKIEKNKKRADDFIASVPSCISSALFDNPYVDCLYSDNQMLMKLVFGDDLLSEIDWYLYDNPGSIITVGGASYTINNHDDFLNFIKNEYHLED